MVAGGSSPRPGRHYAWTVLALGTLSVFGVLGLGRFGYTMVLPAMQAGLGMSNAQAGLLASANLFGYLLMSAAGGALAAHHGPRKVVAAGLLLAGLGMLLTGLAGGFASAALWRTLTGLGSGAGNVAVMGMLSAWFGIRRRGMAAGIAVGGSSLALILLGPLVPAVLAAWGEGGWRACWSLFGGTTLLLSALAFLLLRDRPEEMGLQPYGAGPADTATMEHGERLPWRRVYRATPIWHLGAVYTAFGFSYIIFMTFFTKRLVAEGGYTPAGAGRLFMIMGWFSLLCGPLWGGISDVIGRKRALVIVYLVQATSFALFGLWNAPAGATLASVLFGLTAWSIPAIMAAACGDVLGPRLAPAALGFITLVFGVGQAAGPGVAGAMADAWGSFTPAFILATTVALLGAAGSATLHPSSAGRLP